MNLYPLIRPFLFRLDPERAHRAAMAWAERLGRSRTARRALAAVYGYHSPRLMGRVGGLDLANPVGLAAGFDKNGRAVETLARLGFGHIEVGSVSSEPSEGNPRPRLFRLPQDQAVVVNYGVPNDGAEAVARRLKSYSRPVPLGVNLVETNSGKIASAKEVIAQFEKAARFLTGGADYLALNLACPNTSADRSAFQDPAVLGDLLDVLEAIPNLPPVFPKLSAAVEDRLAGKIIETIAGRRCVAGYIFNLPPGKNYPLKTPPAQCRDLPGTLSGPPTRRLMNDTIRNWYRRIDRDRHVIIGSGGVFTAEHAYEKIRLGASAIQLYTALIYQGPGLVRRIHRGLDNLLARDGFQNVKEAVGADAGA